MPVLLLLGEQNGVELTGRHPSRFADFNGPNLAVVDESIDLSTGKRKQVACFLDRVGHLFVVLVLTHKPMIAVGNEPDWAETRAL